MNIVVLVGRLTRDPELKYGQSGKAYSRFSLAVNRPMSKDEADFINCVAFGKTAELIGEYLRKGRKVGVNGRLQMNKYENRVSYDVLVESIEFLEGKSAERTDSDVRFNEVREPASKQEPTYENTEFVDEDEFPF